MEKLANLSYWWILGGFTLIMIGLYCLFNSLERTKPVKGQLLCLFGMDLVTLLFYLLTFSLRISKIAAEAGVTPRTMPRLWAFLMIFVSAGAFYTILKKTNKPDEKFDRWVFALLVGAGSIFSVIMFNIIGYYLSSAIFILVVMLAMGEKNRLQLVLVPVCWCLFTYLVFYKLLYINLPFGGLLAGLFR